MSLTSHYEFKDEAVEVFYNEAQGIKRDTYQVEQYKKNVI